ncbi:MAG: DUF1501 domain-containing protein [Planctomycetota bacterium]|nr:DUF1501 domain-containing protein [Planctomycetota bacterium]
MNEPEMPYPNYSDATSDASHPTRRKTRRSILRAGALGIGGLNLMSLNALRAADAPAGIDPSRPVGRAKSVLFIFLSGGLSQLDSFDMKPRAPANIRGEFQPVATRTPGMFVCEHLPQLAKQSHRLALVRSLSHWSNEHNQAHTIMLTGRSQLPPAYDEKKPQPTDWPSITSIAGRLVKSRSTGIPAGVVVPQRLLNMNQGGVVTPGQFAGQMGARFDPWFVEASPYRGNDVKGAYPDFAYRRRTESAVEDHSQFQAPVLDLPEGLTNARLTRRAEILKVIERQRRELDRHAESQRLDRFRQSAVSLLTDPKVQNAFDVVRADAATIDRYGQNLFGWTLLMAKRLVEAGVPMVQANLGNYNTWDLHGGLFKISRDFLYPPADVAIAALLDDLGESGLLDETLVVIAGEFGRTPKVFTLPRVYKTAGRDHWGAVQTAVFAGAGVPGGTIIGSSDKIGAYPASAPQRPEDFAATVYHALGLRPTAHWPDIDGRPHYIFHGNPIAGLV